MNKLRGLVLNIALVSLCALLIHCLATLLKPGIQQAEQAQHTQLLLGFLPRELSNASHLRNIPPPKDGWPAPISSDSPLYQVWQQQQPVALLLPITAQGFRGQIQLRVAISPEGKIIASQVLNQQETPGLGAQIAANNAAWLQQFAGASSSASKSLKIEGGSIDHISGATVTSRGASQALTQALLFVRKHPQLLQEQP